MATAMPRTLGEIIDLSEAIPSKLNPRTLYDDVKLAELAASIKAQGILEPLIVRPARVGTKFEIVAGERRYRAAKLAGVTELPVIVRTLTDVQVLELMAIENLQRDDLHPLDEARGYQALQHADPATYTAKAIGAKIGKSERYVQQRLSLVKLAPAVSKAFFDHAISAGHADLLVRLKPADQVLALKAATENLYGEDADRGCKSVRALGHWIDNSVRLPLSTADPQTAELPDLAKAIATPEAAATILQVASGFIPPAARTGDAKGVLSTEAYKQIVGKKDRCTHAQRAVIVLGQGRGTVLDVCTAKTECKTHWFYEIEAATRQAKAAAKPSPVRTAAATKAADAAKARRALEGLREGAIGSTIKAGAKRIANKPTPALLRLLGWNAGSETRYATWRDLVVAELGKASWALSSDREWARAVALFKAFGLTLAVAAPRLVQPPAARQGKNPQTSAPAKRGKAKGKRKVSSLDVTRQLVSGKGKHR
jgi:ParB/RepB/Spo0J family partition protein